jgi:uncharacterized membrane protein YhaH (DUF805 family)
MSGASAPTPGSEPVPLDQPYYGASFGIAVGRFFAKYATFSGRASRSEFWWWFLANFIVSGVLSGIGNIGGGAVTPHGPTVLYVVVNAVLGVWVLATLVPNLALAWRRLHDTNRSGAWWLLTLIPIVGWIIVIVFQASRSVPAGARFDR